MIVVPFKASGKSRLPSAIRHDLSLAMLGDVLTAAIAFGDIHLVTDSDAACELATELGVSLVADPGNGQGAAVATALVGIDGPCLVVNSDLPAVTADDLELLATPAGRGEFGLVEAADGTTNALALPYAASFESLYGAGSAARFETHAAALSLRVDRLFAPNLVDDVDTLEDLERIRGRVGERTRRLLALATR
jgi:2-phospho-L-lactate guanylyltransferase